MINNIPYGYVLHPSDLEEFDKLTADLRKEMYSLHNQQSSYLYIVGFGVHHTAREKFVDLVTKEKEILDKMLIVHEKMGKIQDEFEPKHPYMSTVDYVKFLDEQKKKITD